MLLTTLQSALVKIMSLAAFKNNFIRVQQLVLIGGPNDGVITPWESRY